jgi:predicted nuclease of predicted toxin-antitoxin system
MSKGEDFAALVGQQGPPPHVLWITCGNTSNAALRAILETGLPTAIELIRRGEPLVEISDARAVGRPASRSGLQPGKRWMV